jgi:HD-GYP domain-containing protein (c-di-GMP phosphodiesterase class II)
MKYALAIGRQMGIEGDGLENLGLSGILHDVGKIGIREGVLGKPSRLSPSERRMIERHPLIGVKIVRTIKDSQKIIRGILEHHERIDGRGYPNRLHGRGISAEGKIIALADTFDALTSDRPYRKGLTAKEAVFEIVNNSSRQFDPGVVKAFLASFSKHPAAWSV